MNNYLLNLFCEISPSFQSELEYCIDKFFTTKEFTKKLEKIIDDIAEYLRDKDDGETYPREWDSNPFNLEPHLARGTGQWVWPDTAIEQSRKDSFEKIIDDLEKGFSADVDDMIWKEYGIDEGFPGYEFFKQKLLWKIKRGMNNDNTSK